MTSTLRSLAIALVLFAPIAPHAEAKQAPDADDGGTSSARALGLRPPTDAERAWMDRSLVRTGKVASNALAAQRIKDERLRLNLPALAAPAIAPVGAEVEPLAETDAAPALADASTGGDPGLPADTTTGLLPATVDNSTLPSFPPVRNQGSIGSCAAFSSTYYVGTHMTGLVRGWDNRGTSNTRKLSPRFTYALVNGGADNGSWFSSNLDVLLKLGAPTWESWPYSGTVAHTSYLEWPRAPQYWREAARHRFQQAGRVQSVHQATGLQQAKALLNNGYLLLFATDINGWQVDTLRNNTATTSDDAVVGQQIATYVRTDSSGHAMTIVGYHDEVWTDINKNGLREAAELGAFKIVNSWGTNWGNSGFLWISYDALRATSSVPGAFTPDRAEGYRTAFWGNEVYWIAARPSYTPTLFAEFTLSHARRSDMRLRLGRSATTSSAPTVTWPTALADFNGWQNGYGWPTVFNNLGGPLSLEGLPGTTISAFMALDLTDLVAPGPQRYYLEVTDTETGVAAQVSAFRLTNDAGQVLADAGSVGGVPFAVDAGTQRARIDFTTGAVPVFTSATTASATVGQAFTFQVSASNSPTTYTASNLPSGLSIAAGSGLISGTPTESGTFTVALGASNLAGSASAVLTLAVAAPPLPAPQVLSPSLVRIVAGEPYSASMVVAGTVTAYAATGLPPGITVNPQTGLISGTPTAVGSFTATLSATNAGGTGSRISSFVVTAATGAPVITSPTTASGRSGAAFSYRIEASGGATSFGAIDLPSGLSINASTGTISGVLPIARDYPITLRATNASGSGYALLILTVTGDSSFAPANDAFANRTPLSGASVSIAGSNVNATAETGEPGHGAAKANRSVWYGWTSPGAGTVTLEATGTGFTPILAAYSGQSLGSLGQVAVDAGTAGGATRRVTFTAAAGVAYAFAVDGVNGASGPIQLTVGFTGLRPPNDDFASRLAISGATASTTGNSAEATAETGEPAHDGQPAARSLWWRWTATANGPVEVNTLGSTFDTILGVYTGNTLAGLTRIASDDQGGINNTSRLVFQAVLGVTYAIAVDGWQGASGSVALNVLPSLDFVPPNDAFTSRLPILGTTATINATNVGATAEPGEPDHDFRPARRSVWWTWTAPAAGELTISTVESAFDTVLAVYTGSSLDTLVPIASDDDSGGNSASRLRFAATAGTTYAIAVDGYVGASGALRLALALDTSTSYDDFADAALLEGTNATVSAQNTNASAESGEPDHAGSTAARSLWWTWTAASSGIVNLSTEGSSFDTVLAVYTGNALGSLVSIASNDDSGGTFGSVSALAFYATGGTTYRIAVDGYDGATGSILLTLRQTPGNDLYFTDFESFPAGIDTISGFEGWYVDPESARTTGSTGTFAGFPGTRAMWLGFNPAGTASQVLAYRPIGMDPVATGTPVIRFSAAMKIKDSTNSRYDDFSFVLYNRNGNKLAELNFDNSNNYIYRNDTTGYVDTGKSFVNDQRYALSITMNFATNRWTASITPQGGQPLVLFTDVTMTASGAPRDLGDVSLVWFVRDTATPGNNYLVVDDYRLSVSDTRPNLEPYQPEGWTSPVVISNTTGTTTEVTTLYDDESLTLDWAFLNDSEQSTLGAISYRLLVDGAERAQWSAETLLPRYFHSLRDYPLGRLAAGSHTIEIVADSAGVIAESDEGDNVASKLIVVLPRISGPPNDAFAARIAIASAGGTVEGSSVGASTESGEPPHAGTGGSSVWWSWTAPASGTVTIDTAGSTFDTVLAVYTGSAVGSLVRVAQDDDSAGNLTSRVSFSAVAGTAYAIAVDGFSGESGSVRLTVATGGSVAVPVIVTQPTDRLGSAGESVMLQVTAAAQPAPTYRWQWAPAGDGTWTPLEDGPGIAGATGAQLTLSGLTRTLNGRRYRCVVANSAGQAISNAATLGVAGRPQTLALTAPPATLDYRARVELAPTSSAGLPVTVRVLEGPAVAEGGALRLLGLGPVVAEATQPGDAEFDPATPRLVAFTVTATQIPRPEPSLALQADSLQFGYHALIGLRYQVQSSDAPTGPWNNVGLLVPGDGTVRSQSVPTSGKARVFVRVVVSP